MHVYTHKNIILCAAGKKTDGVSKHLIITPVNLWEI